jgi:hypothetical protein
LAWWTRLGNARKLSGCNELQPILNVSLPETSWWQFVVGMWSFVW